MPTPRRVIVTQLVRDSGVSAPNLLEMRTLSDGANAKCANRASAGYERSAHFRLRPGCAMHKRAVASRRGDSTPLSGGGTGGATAPPEVNRCVAVRRFLPRLAADTARASDDDRRRGRPRLFRERHGGFSWCLARGRWFALLPPFCSPRRQWATAAGISRAARRSSRYAFGPTGASTV